jgi:hypothetical protein
MQHINSLRGQKQGVKMLQRTVIYEVIPKSPRNWNAARKPLVVQLYSKMDSKKFQLLRLFMADITGLLRSPA